MTNGINTRELILQILLEIEEEGKHSHIAIRNALSKYQFLPRQERAFITRVCEGTLEYRILIDYIIDSYSKVSVDKMKPVIREILRSAVYQIRFMDSVPDSAVCNEAVKLAQRKGFYSLKPFVNGIDGSSPPHKITNRNNNKNRQNGIHTKNQVIQHFAHSISPVLKN